MLVSVLILTHNEAINIDDCLASVAFSDDLLVLDSGSADDTRARAAAHGARVFERPFDDWSSQQNHACVNLPFRHPWVLHLDADERCSDELREELLALPDPAADVAAFRLRRKDFFQGRWLRRAQLYPTWLVRVFRPQRTRFRRRVNQVAVVDGAIGILTGHLHHYPFSHGIGQWIDRHNRYAVLEALESLAVNGPLEVQAPPWRACLSRDPLARRACLKRLFARLPARHVLKFLYYLIIRRGLLDGRPGLCYLQLMAIYEYMIICHQRELRGRDRAGPPA